MACVAYKKRIVLCRTISSFSMTPFFLRMATNLPILHVWPNNSLLSVGGLCFVSRWTPLFFVLESRERLLPFFYLLFDLKMFATKSLSTSSCKRSPNLRLLPRPNCTIDRNQMFHWSTGIRAIITADNDHNKGHPFNYRFHRLLFKQHLPSWFNSFFYFFLFFLFFLFFFYFIFLFYNNTT